MSLATDFKARTESTLIWGTHCEALWPPWEKVARVGVMYSYELHTVAFVFILSSKALKYRLCSMVPCRQSINPKGRNALLCLRSNPIAIRISTSHTSQLQLTP